MKIKAPFKAAVSYERQWLHSPNCDVVTRIYAQCGSSRTRFVQTCIKSISRWQAAIFKAS